VAAWRFFRIASELISHTKTDSALHLNLGLNKRLRISKCSVASRFSVGLDRIREFCKKWHVGCSYEVDIAVARVKTEKTFVFLRKRVLVRNQKEASMKKESYS
jgi:hypothetical protein